MTPNNPPTPIKASTVIHENNWPLATTNRECYIKHPIAFLPSHPLVAILRYIKCQYNLADGMISLVNHTSKHQNNVSADFDMEKLDNSDSNDVSLMGEHSEKRFNE